MRAPIPARFPSQSELKNLESTEVNLVAAPNVVLVDQWRIDAASETSELGPWQRLLREEAPENVHGDVALDCTAREIARMTLEKGGLPDERSRSFLGARCGSTLPSLGAGFLSGTADPRVPEADLLAQARSTLKTQLLQLGSAQQVAGIGFARQGEKYSVALVMGVPEATLALTTRRVDTNEVTIRGEVRGAVQDVSALVNQGPRGVAACAPDGRPGLNFRFRCPVDPADQSTWIEVLVQRPGALLRSSVARLLVFRDEEASRTYAPATAAPASATSGDFAQVVAERVNVARSEVHLAPVELLVDQSVENGKLAKHFLAGAETGNLEAVNLAAMGMLAGYSVNKPIQNGGIFGQRLSSATDPGSWVDYALEQPLGRSVLLDPRMSTIAVGALPTAPNNAAAAVITTYQIFRDTAPEQLAAEVVGAFNRGRKSVGAQPAAVWNDEGLLAQNAANIPLHSRSSESFLQAVMQKYSSARHRSAHAIAFETNQLSQIEFPEQLLRAAGAEIGIGVSRRSVEGVPWGTYVVLMVFSQGEQTMTANAPASSATF